MFIEGDEKPMSPEVERMVEEMNLELGFSTSTADRIHVMPVDEFPNPAEARHTLSPAKRLVERQRLRNLMKVRVRAKPPSK